MRLSYWRFNTSAFTNEAGQHPTTRSAVDPPLSSWSSNAVFLDAGSLLRYREMETNGLANINCRSGTLRFWFKPSWTSVNLGGTGTSNEARLLEVGRYLDDASAGVVAIKTPAPGNEIDFLTQSNGVQMQYIVVPRALSSATDGTRLR